MFGDTKQQNRRLTPKERQEELQEAKIWDHYPRDYILDMPFYKNMPITPLVPRLNFDLNYKE